MKDIDDAPDLSDNEMPLITSHESSTDAGRTNTQKSTDAEVVKSPPSLEKNSGIAKSPENAMGKEKPQTKSQEVSAIQPANCPTVLSECSEKDESSSNSFYLELQMT